MTRGALSTSLTISNVGPRSFMGVNFYYRSPVDNTTDVTVVARTYSPGTGGNGTQGIAYAGRPYGLANQAFTRMTTTVRNGAFGHDGDTRATRPWPA